MKLVSILRIATLIITASFLTSHTWAKSSGTHNNINAQEIYLAVYPSEQRMEIIEYNLVSNNSNEKEISRSVKNLKKLINKSSYSLQKYNFKYFTPIEEKVSNEKKFIKAEYDLVTQERHLKNILSDAFSGILNREVEARISEGKIGLVFDGTGVNIADNNALNVYAGKNNQRMIVWDMWKTKFDIVLNFDAEGKTPLLKYIKKTIKGPRKTQEEIDILKYSSPSLKGSLQGFQDDADIYRMKHIKYYGKILEEYKKKTGEYPFESLSKEPVYVFIAHDRQEKYAQNMGEQNPNKHTVVSFKKFVKEIENKLGRKINQYFDPQYAADIKPNFYIYVFKDNKYFFATHVSNYYSFAKKLLNNYYKVEISSSPPSNSKIMTYSDLIKNKSFIKQLKKKASKEDFFLEREKRYIDYIK